MPGYNSERRIQGYCGLCIARCGTVAVLEDGRFTRLEPDPTHPTGQALCAKGRAAPELVYHPDRLTQPLRRTRPKGHTDPGWETISWDAALDLTANAMRRIAAEHGPEAVCFSLSSPSTTAVGDAAPFISRLKNAFGTPNAMTSFDLCGWGRAGAARYTFGVPPVGTSGGGAMPDIANSGCLILWGYNPSFTRLTHATATVEALKRGTKLIVVDPRHAGLANKADVWLRVRPGTDGALALGIANLMIQRGWYDREFVRAWTNGPMLVRADDGRMLDLAWDSVRGCAVPFDGDTNDFALEGEYRVATPEGEVLCHPAFELYARLCRGYSTRQVEAICWVPAAKVVAAAELIWHARPVSYYAWSGHEHHANVTQTARAMSLLYALTGCFDAPGGNVLFPSPPSASVAGEELVTRKAPALGVAERPLGPAQSGNVGAQDLYRAILEGEPYKVRGLLGFGSNMLLAHANGGYGRKALAALDFFTHCDLFMTPTAAMADVVLPVASCFEREALKLGFEISAEAQSRIQFRPAVVPPQGGARSDTEIAFALAQRLGFGELFWQGDIEAAYRHQLAPTGITLEQLRVAPGGLNVPLQTRYRKYTEHGFATSSHKVELYSPKFLEHGYPPLPDFEEPPIGPTSRPDLATRFPLVLTCAKRASFCQSQHRALPSLRKSATDPEVELHPAAAGSRGIANGDWVAIETPEGSVRARARLNRELDPRVVVGEHGWWQACTDINGAGYDPFGPQGANLNLLIGTVTLDPVSGTAPHKSYLCEIQRIA
jgi:anaerobic selenocysteine-containing dehydrogenase